MAAKRDFSVALVTLASALTLIASPLLAEEIDTGPADFIQNVAQDADQCAYTAEATGYDYALTTNHCKRFMDNAMKAIKMGDEDYIDYLAENKPSLLVEMKEDLTTIQKSARRMQYLSQQ